MKKILLLLAAAAVFLLIGIAASLLMTRMRPKNDSSVSSGMLSGAAVSAAGISAADASAIGISAADASVSGISAAASQADVSVIPASEAVPDSKTSETSDLSAVSSPAAQADLFCDTSSLYTYDEMASDLNALSQSYSDLLTLGSLGQTPDGRELYHVLIGNKSASQHVLVFASIHAREYMTTQVCMKQLADFLSKLKNGGEYQGTPVSELLKDRAVHFIPMINPDGVTISQLGIDGLKNESVRETVRQIAAMDGGSDSSYFRKWKSNAQGIDLNRNFDADWDIYDDQVGHPSADHYKGTFPGCAPEAQALITLTQSYPFTRTISYHTQGGVIYWYFKQTGDLRTVSENFAQVMGDLTGYPLDDNYEALDPAGYKDWAISKMNIPSLTIEIGSGTSPVPADQLDSLYKQNADVWYALLQDTIRE